MTTVDDLLGMERNNLWAIRRLVDRKGPMDADATRIAIFLQDDTRAAAREIASWPSTPGAAPAPQG